MSQMATSPKYAGRRLGEKLTHWAYRYAQGSSISRLRWDAWRDNEKLIRYYQQLGATFIRTESPAHRQSGALFEVAFRASSVSSFNDPGDKSLQLIPNQSIQTYYPSEDASNHGASNVYMSMHQIDDLKLPPLHAKRSLHIEPMTTGCSGTHPENMATIYNTGGQWRAHWFFSHAIESWPLLANLVEGIPYQIRHVQASTLTSKCALYCLLDALGAVCANFLHLFKAALTRRCAPVRWLARAAWRPFAPPTGRRDLPEHSAPAPTQSVPPAESSTTTRMTGPRGDLTAVVGRWGRPSLWQLVQSKTYHTEPTPHATESLSRPSEGVGVEPRVIAQGVNQPPPG